MLNYLCIYLLVAISLEMHTLMMPKQKDKPYLEDINSRIEVNEES